MRNSFSIEFVGDSHFNFIQHVQNVKFCQSNAVGQVTRNRIFFFKCAVYYYYDMIYAGVIKMCSDMVNLLQYLNTTAKKPADLAQLF